VGNNFKKFSCESAATFSDNYSIDPVGKFYERLCLIATRRKNILCGIKFSKSPASASVCNCTDMAFKEATMIFNASCLSNGMHTGQIKICLLLQSYLCWLAQSIWQHKLFRTSMA
jgi:hypothetical protein